MAGRVAEEVIYDEMTVGARTIWNAPIWLVEWLHIGEWKARNPVSYKTSDEDPFLGREMHQQRKFSEHTQELISGEVARVLHTASSRERRTAQPATSTT
ncbi:MAG: hypothetical protein U0930_21570 [Pirellulales bacterium]